MPLPPCHSRHAIAEEREWYLCSHPEVFTPGRRVHFGNCIVCQYADQPAPAQPVAVPVFPAVPRTALCGFLGEQVGERHCPTCRGSVRLKVFRCGHPQHTETTYQECAVCGDYEAVA